ncbi:MAG: hypothetical protein MJ202_10720 [Lentisphaeria bacterium]|nr:hypothetical protein [Lentisphaeria bacterium]
MGSIDFSAQGIANKQMELSIDFFNDEVYRADSESRDVGNESGRIGERPLVPGDWKPQLDSMLERVAEEEEHGVVGMSEISQLLQIHGIQIAPEEGKALEAVLGKMERTMAELNEVKKSGLMADKLVQELHGDVETKSLARVDNAIEAQRNLAAKLRDIGKGHPEIQAQLEEMAGRCESKAGEISDAVELIAPDARAKEIMQRVNRLPEMLGHLEAELDSCRIGGELKNAVMMKYRTVRSVCSTFGSPENLQMLAKNILFMQNEYEKGVDAAQVYGASEIESLCEKLSALSGALRDLRGEEHASQGLEDMADAVDGYMARVVSLGNELPELLGMDKDETFQSLRNVANRAQWKPRLDAVLSRVSREMYGNVDMEAIDRMLIGHEQGQDQPIVNLADGDRQELSALKDELKRAMDALHGLKGADIRNAYTLESSGNGEGENQNVIADTIDNAISAQQNLADKLRAVGKKYDVVQDRMEELADKCDRRVSEILATVNQIVNPPRAEEILREMGKGPEALKQLESVLDASGAGNDLKAMVRQKYDKAMEALGDLGAQNALTLDYELQHEPANGQPTHFEKATEALNALSDALRELRGQNQSGEAFENMADAVDRHMLHILNLGMQLPDLLNAHDDETVMELMIAAVPQMHGTQEILAHFSNELAPLMQKLDDFTKAPEARHDFGEVLMMSRKLTEIKQGMTKMLREGQIGLPDGSRFIPDASILEPLKGLLDKAQKSMDNFVGFFQKNAKTHQLGIAISQSVPVNVPDGLLKSNFWKTHFPNLNRVAGIAAGIHRLGKVAQSDSPAAVDSMKKLRLELEELRRQGSVFWSRFNREVNDLGRLKTAMREHMNGKAFSNQAFGKLVEELKEQKETERQTGDVLLAINKDEFENFRTGLIAARPEVFDYEMRRLENILSNVGEQNQLCDEYMKGAMLQKALKENIPLSTIIETRLHNVPMEYVDETCDDSNLVEPPKNLGSGNANAVKKCSFRTKDGSIVDKVFKPEYAGALGNLNLCLGANGAPTLQNAYLNIASQKVAAALKSGEIMPKTSVGMLQGEYGLFMDFVQGSTPGNISPEYLDIIQNMSPEQRKELCGSLMKQCNKLQWNDLLMAQGDRHHNNYAFCLKEVNGKYEANLVAYDNDACLADWRPGLTKVNIKGFYNMALDHVCPGGKENFFSQVEARGGLIREQDGSVTVDTSKMNLGQLEIIHKVTGMHTFKVPEYMDQDIYDGLMELQAHPGAFDACLPSDLTSASRGAAKARLREMIDLAVRYKAEGRVLDSNQWGDPNVQNDVKTQNAKTLFEAGGGFGGLDRLLTDFFFRDLSWLMN